MKKLERIIEKNLAGAVRDFRQAIQEGKESLLKNLSEYERLIAGNIEEGCYGIASMHAKLLADYYVDENPWRNERNKGQQIEAYTPKDAGKKAYKIGLAAKRIANIIDNQ